jgi:TonB family protein
VVVRVLIAFILTVMVYTLLLWFYFSQLNRIKPLPAKSPKEHIIKIDIQTFQSPPKPPKRVKTPKTPPKPLPKKLSKPKKIKKRKITKKIKVKRETKHQKITSKTSKKPKILAPSEMIFIENPLMLNSEKTPKSPYEQKITPSPKIKKLYGQSFDHFSSTQKKFIVERLDEIHRITQQTLSRRGYPAGALAARTGQEGINIVSFDLHPNGDISNLRLLQKVGYRALDENTLETIRTAYKDYPYPQETTKIIFYVEYSIFGY